MAVTDSLLQAVSIVTKAELSKTKSDITRQYVISDIIDADSGVYKASTSAGNTNLQIEVYRRAGDAKQYQVGDSVDVHIPEGDYSRTKTIISTYATSGGGGGNGSGSETSSEKEVTATESWVKLNSLNGKTSNEEEKEITVSLSKTDSGRVASKEYDISSTPIYLCNYKSVRICGKYQVQFGEFSTKLNGSPYWEMYLYVYDGLAKRYFKYAFNVNQDYINTYMSGSKTIPADIIIDINENNLRIDKYWFKVEISPNAVLQDAAGEDLSRFLLKWINPEVQLGWKKSEYVDGAVYIYEEKNKKFFDNKTELYLGAKINYNEKEMTITEAVVAFKKAAKTDTSAAKTDASVTYAFCWSSGEEGNYLGTQTENGFYKVTPFSINDSVAVYQGGIYKLPVGTVTDTNWSNAKENDPLVSSALSFDYNKNLQYNYSVKIVSTSGLIVTSKEGQDNTTTQLKATIYRGNTLLAGPEPMPEEEANYADATIYYKLHILRTWGGVEKAKTTWEKAEQETWGGAEKAKTTWEKAEQETWGLRKSYWVFESPGTMRELTIKWIKVGKDSESGQEVEVVKDNPATPSVVEYDAFTTIKIGVGEVGTYRCIVEID